MVAGRLCVRVIILGSALELEPSEPSHGSVSTTCILAICFFLENHEHNVPRLSYLTTRKIKATMPAQCYVLFRVKSNFNLKTPSPYSLFSHNVFSKMLHSLGVTMEPHPPVNPKPR